MAVKISFDYTHSFNSKKSVPEVYAFLEDYKKSIVETFPGLKSVTENPNGEFHWIFDTISHAGYKVNIDFLTRFEKDSNRRLSILPVPGKTTLSADYTLSEKNAGTEVSFKSRFETELPLPSFLKSMAQPFAEKGIRSLFAEYLTNVEQALK